jgi:hypothetical protein
MRFAMKAWLLSAVSLAEKVVCAGSAWHQQEVKPVGIFTIWIGRQESKKEPTYGCLAAGPGAAVVSRAKGVRFHRVF